MPELPSQSRASAWTGGCRPRQMLQGVMWVTPLGPLSIGAEPRGVRGAVRLQGPSPMWGKAPEALPCGESWDSHQGRSSRCNPHVPPCRYNQHTALLHSLAHTAVPWTCALLNSCRAAPQRLLHFRTPINSPCSLPQRAAFQHWTRDFGINSLQALHQRQLHFSNGQGSPIEAVAMCCPRGGCISVVVILGMSLVIR